MKYYCIFSTFDPHCHYPWRSVTHSPWWYGLYDETEHKSFVYKTRILAWHGKISEDFNHLQDVEGSEEGIIDHLHFIEESPLASPSAILLLCCTFLRFFWVGILCSNAQSHEVISDGIRYILLLYGRFSGTVEKIKWVIFWCIGDCHGIVGFATSLSSPGGHCGYSQQRYFSTILECYIDVSTFNFACCNLSPSSLKLCFTCQPVEVVLLDTIRVQ